MRDMQRSAKRQERTSTEVLEADLRSVSTRPKSGHLGCCHIVLRNATLSGRPRRHR